MQRLMTAMFPFEGEAPQVVATKRSKREQFIKSAIDRAASGQKIPLNQLLAEVEGVPQAGQGTGVAVRPGTAPAGQPSLRDFLKDK